jgi:endonuclease YncB( thermonuclease family)
MLRPLLPVLLAAATVGWACALHSQGPRATVLSVGDGDSIRVRQGGRAITVRIACIDAPEMDQRPEGEQARRYLRLRLPEGREVSLDVKTIDRYGRTVAEVISDGNIGLAMVEDGQAFAFRRYLSDCDAEEYLQAEFRASRRRHGVWRQEGGITRPWEHRRQPRPPRGERPPEGERDPQPD